LLVVVEEVITSIAAGLY